MTCSNPSGSLGLWLSLALAGCGVSSAGGGNGGGGSGGGAGTGGATDSCAALVTDATATPVTVRLVNHTAGDLYVAIADQYTCGGEANAFTIQDASNASVPIPGSPGCGPVTCSTPSCGCVVTYTCNMMAPVTRIASQGILTGSWSALVLETRTVPTACVADPTCYGAGSTQSCQVLTAAKDYPYKLTASLQTSVSCQGAGCTCTPDASGTCVLPGTAEGVPSGSAVTAVATLTQGETNVDIVFQ